MKTSSTVYEQHHAHTQRTSAHAVLHGGEHVASVTIAYPKDGAGRLYAYAHWIGSEMVRGQAKGYGYDKRSAALSDAASKRLAAVTSIRGTAEASFWEGLANSDNGKVWDHELETHGFKIAQVC